MLIPAIAPGPGGGEDEVLTPQEAARLFRVTTDTITRWAKAGKLRSFRTLGGHRRFYASEVTATIRNARTPTRTP
jgi:excisionase family DNA binding protein